jgi:hypothetical protein
MSCQLLALKSNHMGLPPNLSGRRLNSSVQDIVYGKEESITNGTTIPMWRSLRSENIISFFSMSTTLQRLRAAQRFVASTSLIQTFTARQQGTRNLLQPLSLRILKNCCRRWVSTVLALLLPFSTSTADNDFPLWMRTATSHALCPVPIMATAFRTRVGAQSVILCREADEVPILHFFLQHQKRRNFAAADRAHSEYLTG